MMMPLTLSPDDLLIYMREHAIPGEILRLEVPTPTVETAAQAVGVRPEQIIKSILFTVDGQPLLAIACGPSYVDRRSIAGQYGVGKKRVKLATPVQVVEISGYEVGAMPPFGHRKPIPTLLDQRVLELSEAYAGGGGENVLIRLAPPDILQATQAQVLDLISPPGNTGR
jgi:prolyl-tRNA editing enzyme YbaK/EbsC (Cys-tRNA(Pro) deacylase)